MLPKYVDLAAFFIGKHALPYIYKVPLGANSIIVKAEYNDLIAGSQSNADNTGQFPEIE